MKKSEIYRMLQCIVIDNRGIRTAQKAEILRELMEREDLASFCEEQELEVLMRDTESEDDETV